MPILQFPNIKADKEGWGITFNTQSFRSDLTGIEQTLELDGAKWNASLTFANRYGVEARSLRGFLTSLRGKAGRFYLSPEDANEKTGSALGTPVSTTASSNGGANQLNTEGWLVNQDIVLGAGDWFEFNGELKQITSDVASDANGDALLTFEPSLRKGWTIGANVVTLNPKCVMKLKSNNGASWNVSTPIIYAMTFACEEALDA
jgi:hypothetical protein